MKLLLSIIVIAILFVAFVRYLEHTSVFYPDTELTATPKDLGFNYEDALITTSDDIQIHGWLIKSPQAKSTVIFFHGNAGNISGRLEKIELLHNLGLNVLMIDYRGYGKSQGTPSEKGIYLDGLAAYDYLMSREDMADQKVISYGSSLGGVVAIELAMHRDVQSVILDSTFSSVIDIAKWVYPFIPSFLVQTKMDCVRKIQNVLVPKLFIHSVDDQTIPFRLGKKLFDAAPEPKEFVKITGLHTEGHIYEEDKVRNAIRTFLTEQGLLQ